MILRWVIIGDIDGVKVEDTYANVINNGFREPDKTKNGLMTVFRMFNGIKIPLTGFGACIEQALNHALNNHISENYKLTNLYLYNDGDGGLKEVSISDYI